MKNMKKPVAIILAVTLLVGVVVGGTIAWLTDESDEVKNVFTTSTIGVELTETQNTYKMIPGWTIDKDPKAWVTEGSEEGYLFVKIEKSDNFDTYMDYAIAEPWTELTAGSGVYYIKITEDKVGKDFIILGDGSKEYGGVTYSWEDNQVLVKPTVTKDMMDKIGTNPTMTFTAYASQLYKTNKGGEETQFTAAEAWALVKPNP